MLNLDLPCRFRGARLTGSSVTFLYENTFIHDLQAKRTTLSPGAAVENLHRYTRHRTLWRNNGTFFGS